MKSESKSPLVESLRSEVEELRRQLYEANETIEAIRTGQVDALVVQSGPDHQLYTLKTADQSYRVFIERMTEGALTLNRSGIILYANTQFSLMVEKPLQEIIGASFASFVAPARLPAYESLLSDSRQGDHRGEIELMTCSLPRPVQISLTALDLEDDIFLSIILTDLTVQKAVQMELEQNNQQLAQLNLTLEASNHDLQQFAYIASHDMQEPLRKIQIFANLLRDRERAGSGEPAEVFLDKILKAAARMKSLIVDVLDYSKLSADTGKFILTDLNPLMQEVLEDFELMAQKKGARLVTGNLPTLEVNPGQIRQVFQNLISNALKFSDPVRPPLVGITAKLIQEKRFDSPEQSGGSFCLLSFRDNGIGFEEKYTEKIFSLFERLHSKDVYEGTGIGLAITKKIIEKHHGLIAVQSTVGAGTQFQIILPLRHDG